MGQNKVNITNFKTLHSLIFSSDKNHHDYFCTRHFYLTLGHCKSQFTSQTGFKKIPNCFQFKTLYSIDQDTKIILTHLHISYQRLKHHYSVFKTVKIVHTKILPEGHMKTGCKDLPLDDSVTTSESKKQNN